MFDEKKTLNDLVATEFTVAGNRYRVRPIPYRDARPMVDIIRCSLSRLSMDEMMTANDEGQVALVPLLLRLVSLLTTDELDELESRLHRYTDVYVEDMPVPLSAHSEKAFNGNVMSGYEVLVRSWCASFLTSFIDSPFLLDLRGSVGSP